MRRAGALLVEWMCGPGNDFKVLRLARRKMYEDF
jgi:hypothetical protein